LKGDEEATLGYGDFLEGLKELKALPLKDQRWRLKNEIFRVSLTVILF